MTPDAKTTKDLRRRLLAWYDRHARRLVWRAPPGTVPDPYRVWLSEVMLQQTTVVAVAPYYRDFVHRWPGVHDLAAARLDQVLHAWQSLGYYARARNYWLAHAWSWPRVGASPKPKRAFAPFPGSAPIPPPRSPPSPFRLRPPRWTATWCGSVARLFAVADRLPGARSRIDRLAASLTPARRPGDFAQAMMDLGASVCTVREPACGACPWRGHCAGRRSGRPEAFPVKAPKGRISDPPRRGLLGGPPGWRRPVAPPPGERALGRHDGGALDGMARGSLEPGRSPRGGAAGGRVAAAARRGAPHLHPLSPGSCRAGGTRRRRRGRALVPRGPYPGPRAADGDEEGDPSRPRGWGETDDRWAAAYWS